MTLIFLFVDLICSGVRGDLQFETPSKEEKISEEDKGEEKKTRSFIIRLKVKPRKAKVDSNYEYYYLKRTADNVEDEEKKKKKKLKKNKGGEQKEDVEVEVEKNDAGKVINKGALVQAGLRTFRDDDEIERGKKLEFELCEAIQQSRISILVLSKNYTSSKWCLDEVAMILDWSRSSSSHEVLPVSYDMDPSDGIETIEGFMLDMQMYKDDAFNVRKGKKRLYDEFRDTFLPSNQGSSFRRHYFNFLTVEPSSAVDFNYDAFSRMHKLKLLKLNYAKMMGCYGNFPEGLRWLCWHGFPLKSIPLDLPLGNLVSLDMSYSKLEHVWVGNKVLLSLKILNLSHSQRLVKTPNFRGLPNLEKLILEGCVSLVEVCDTIGNLEASFTESRKLQKSKEVSKHWYAKPS
ncbi:hypothetical protein LguiB_006551 [Lonicera macranthoides]